RGCGRVSSLRSPFSLSSTADLASFVALGNGGRDALLQIQAICQAARVLFARHEPAEVDPALAGHGFQPLKLVEGIGVVVYPEVEQRIVLLVVDQQGGRLPAS